LGDDASFRNLDPDIVKEKTERLQLGEQREIDSNVFAQRRDLEAERAGVTRRAKQSEQLEMRA
jgi:hypothetical protein